MDKPEKPKSKWSDLVGSLGRDLSKLGQGVEKAYREAADSDAGRQIRQTLTDAGTQAKKAAHAVGPELKKVVDQVRPDVERAIDQLKPEVEKLIDRAKPVVKGVVDDLAGRTSRDETATPPRSSSPPNVSPDVVDDEDPGEHTQADQVPESRPAAPPRSKPKSSTGQGSGPTKTIGRKPPSRS